MRTTQRLQTPDEFGLILRAERKAKGLTQENAAELAGVGARLWNEAERGKRRQLGLETALRMPQTLGLDIIVESRAQRTEAP